ncbi:hypothetical protein DACRYDRAFT_119795 [Dacryopinax primogenitus]|uniref:Xylose isomerase-like TIM barrel domain-containing protein n=1 Tax=Dacryopinax primogenitus (strain DJM 731) TaxID=1858805 RepID=M5FN85_DACPD|nr:uncharacterized protein DACRYDRAFT_119795 [Dacryopinax primogenitus]EJT97005.1 hypothetical protein DACRYDRAFT_119795 [Dacryopinax primogenitus]
MRTIKGPAIFVAQYLSTTVPYDTLSHLAQWASSLGYKGLQLPVDPRLIDITRAANDKTYCDALRAECAQYGIEITELSTHLQGQLIAVHPAYETLFDGFAPPALRGDTQARTGWARNQLVCAAKASKNLGLKAHATFSGALAWPFFYPWPQRPPGLIETAFTELAHRWLPILDAFDACGIDLCYELHPGEDLHDGTSFDRFLAAVGGHRRACILYDPSHFVLQGMDYLEFVKIYHERIRMVHVKDAEFRPEGRQGVYGGYADWTSRAGRFRALGKGQIDFPALFTLLAAYDFPGWAVLENEDPFEEAEECARRGALLIDGWIVKVREGGGFDDFAESGVGRDGLRKVLGLE